MADDGNDGGPGWTGAFDPVRGVRALGEIQRRGLRAASDLVDRLISGVDGDRTTADPPATSGVEELVETWARLTKQSVQMLGELLRGGMDRVGRGAALDEVVIRVNPLHPTATAPVFVHNDTSAVRHRVRLHCGELRDHRGRTVAVAFTPEGGQDVAAGATAGFVVTAPVEPVPGPGTYRGVILAANLPDVWLPFTVVVEDGDGVRAD